MQSCSLHTARVLRRASSVMRGWFENRRYAYRSNCIVISYEQSPIAAASLIFIIVMLKACSKITRRYHDVLVPFAAIFIFFIVRAKDTINQLKEEISNLSKLVEKGAGLSVGQENMVKELIRVRDELTRKTDEQGQTIAVR